MVSGEEEEAPRGAGAVDNPGAELLCPAPALGLGETTRREWWVHGRARGRDHLGIVPGPAVPGE